MHKIVELPEIEGVIVTDAEELVFVAGGVPLRARFTPDEMRQIGEMLFRTADAMDSKASAAADTVLQAAGRRH